MPMGAGKYDEFTTFVREQTQASAVMVCVVGGNLGSGFDVQLDVEPARRAIAMISVAAMLREIAACIERDLRGS
jgi:hypothetical protein